MGKTIPESGADEDITLSEDETVTVEICSFCNVNPCECLRLVCPFHGNVRAIKDGDDFNCEIKDCEIHRKRNELEA